MSTGFVAALTAAVMSVLEFVELVWGSTGVTKEYIEAVLMVVAPILVWLIPSWTTRRQIR